MANNFENTIKAYLDNRAKTDSLFAATYAKANKTLKECCKYIISQARKIGGTAVAVDDATVYGWAIHYYDEDDLKVESSVPPVKVATPATPVPEVKEVKVKKVSKKQKAIEELEQRQLSLFDML